MLVLRIFIEILFYFSNIYLIKLSLYTLSHHTHMFCNKDISEIKIKIIQTYPVRRACSIILYNKLFSRKYLYAASFPQTDDEKLISILIKGINNHEIRKGCSNILKKVSFSIYEEIKYIHSIVTIVNISWDATITPPIIKVRSFRLFRMRKSTTFCSTTGRLYHSILYLQVFYYNNDTSLNVVTYLYLQLYISYKQRK